MYHNKFSTSSYLLPSPYFRAHGTLYRYDLEPEDFSGAGEKPSGFDAMSNTSYLVVRSGRAKRGSYSAA